MIGAESCIAIISGDQERILMFLALFLAIQLAPSGPTAPVVPSNRSTRLFLRLST